MGPSAGIVEAPQGMSKISLSLLWLSLVLFLVLVIAFLLPVPPNDYWWYLRLGKDILSNRAIPQVDTFSFTVAGQPVVYFSWLSGVIFYLVNQAGGITLTVFCRGVLLAIFYGTIWAVCRGIGAGPKLASLVTLLAILAGSNNWAVRPQLLAYPLFGVALWWLVKWEAGERRYLWLLPLLSLLWVNLHPSFLLLFLLVGAQLVGEKRDRKTLALLLAAMFLASLANPRGPLAWEDIILTIRNPSNAGFSVEWGPPVNQGWQMRVFFGWLVAFPLLVALSSRRLNLTQWLWFLGFGWMALSGMRYVIWFLAILALLSAQLLQPWLGKRIDRPPRKIRPATNLPVSAILLVLPMLALPGVRETWWANSPPALTEDTPVAAAGWLTEHPELPGPMWSDYAYASYLIYALPERPVWIDTRFHQYPPEQWEKYLEISEAAPGWEGLLAEDGVRLLVLKQADQGKLLDVLQNDGSWREWFDRDGALIYGKR